MHSTIKSIFFKNFDTLLFHLFIFTYLTKIEDWKKTCLMERISFVKQNQVKCNIVASLSTSGKTFFLQMVALKSRLFLATSLQHEVISNMVQVITIFCHVLLNMSSRVYLRLKFQIAHSNFMNMKKIYCLKE